MKWILGISIFLNIILGYRLLTQKEVSTKEKIIVKKSKPKIIERKVFVEVPATKKQNPPGSSEAPKSSKVVEFDEKDMDDVVNQVQQDRDDFLIGELGFTPQDFEKLSAIKNKYQSLYQEVLPPSGENEEWVGDLTLEHRRQLLLLDEQKEAEYARAIGQQKWEKFQQFKEEYNRKMYSKQVNGPGFIVPMEL